MMSGAWVAVEDAITTASISGSAMISSGSLDQRSTPRAVAADSAAAGLASTIATRSAFGTWLAITSAWRRPNRPTPKTATRTRVVISIQSFRSSRRIGDSVTEPRLAFRIQHCSGGIDDVPAGESVFLQEGIVRSRLAVSVLPADAAHPGRALLAQNLGD